jgi:Ser/Thr protein kinase RdoA (MazF antagonist)
MTGFERLSETDAAAHVAAQWNLDVQSAARLDTERDDSFHVVAAEGEFSFKLAHPDDTRGVIDLQSGALTHAASSGLPLQTVVGTSTFDGRVGRLLTWLPGRLLASETTEPDLFLLGAALGRLSAALADFDHPLARRTLAWDLAQLPLSRPLLELFPSAEASEVFSRFGTRVTPVLADLPRQVAHNDFHPGNVLVDAASADYVVGVLDFGDVVHTVRVADLAIALSYLSEHDAFTAGFESRVPLTDLERSVLDDLVATRLALRMLLNAELDRGTPDNRADPQSSWERTRATLEAHLAKGD